MTLQEIMDKGFCVDEKGKVVNFEGDYTGDTISKEDLIKVKRETVMRYESENHPYKYRDVRSMLWNGVIGYKDCSDEIIEEEFYSLEALINEDDIEWAIYQEEIIK